MNICIVGVCDIAYSTNTMLANGFRNLGHTVTTINYRTILCQTDQNKMNEIVEEQIVKTAPHDLVVFCKVDTIRSATLNSISNKFKTFYWFVDPIQTAFTIKAAEKAANCIVSSATCTKVQQYFNEKGADAAHIVEGVDVNFYTPDFNKTQDIDVLFIGTKDQKREDLIKKSKHKIITYGPGWVNGPLYADDAVSKIRNAKICLNITRDSNSFSDRCFIVMACGSFLLTSNAKDLGPLRNVCSVFNTLEEMDNKITYWLSNENLRLYLSRKGYGLVNYKYTYEDTCKHILYHGGLL